LPEPKDYSYEWDCKRLFIDDAQIIKKQYFYIHYSENNAMNEEKLAEVKDITWKQSQLQEMKDFSRCFDKNLSYCGGVDDLKWQSVRSIFDANFVPGKEGPEKPKTQSTTREIIFS
jgi:hypothetical protein